MPSVVEFPKFGSVIEFTFGEFTCLAMVITTEGEEVITDEGSGALGDTGQALVLGLERRLTRHVDDPVDTTDWSTEPYHRPGETAALPKNKAVRWISG